MSKQSVLVIMVVLLTIEARTYRHKNTNRTSDILHKSWVNLTEISIFMAVLVFRRALLSLFLLVETRSMNHNNQDPE